MDKYESKKNYSTAVALINTCECTPGKVYASRGSYKQHLKSQKHQYWLLKGELKKLKEDLTRKEIEIRRKKAKIESLQENNFTLLEQLSKITKEKRLKKHKKANDEVD